MTRNVWFGIATVFLALNFSAAASFETVKAKNFAGDKMVFPAVVQGADLHLLFLGIAKDQDNGTYQGEELVKWHEALIAMGVDDQATRFWHFSVIENPPFFVKGLIRRGIAKEYVDLMPPEQGSVLFVDDVQVFAAAAGVAIDGQPTVAIYSEAQGVLAQFRGEATDSAVAELVAALTGLLPTGT